MVNNGSATYNTLNAILFEEKGSNQPIP